MTIFEGVFLIPRFIFGIYTEYIYDMQAIFFVFLDCICYIHPMPGQRSADQKLIPVQMNEKFIVQIDAAVIVSGYSDRSKFIRDAIVEKLESMGIQVPAEISSAPSKIGKGGRKKQGMVNLMPNPGLTPKLKKIADDMVREATGKIRRAKQKVSK